MAVTKIWSHRRLTKRENVNNDVRKSVSDGIYYAVNPEKTTMDGMQRVINAVAPDMGEDVARSILNGILYAENEAKTMKSNENRDSENCFRFDDDCRFVTGINCAAGKNAIDDFVETKVFWDNLQPEITHMHAIQSFQGQECSPETAHEIGVELANRLWGDRFQVVVCTHLNTENVHNHFIINATSFVDGKRFYRNDAMYGKMREQSDILCQKYGLSVVKPGKALHGKSYYYRELERNGAPTRLAIARAAVDIAIENSTSLPEMIAYLEAHDYECDFSANHKHWTIRSLGWEKPVRLSRLEHEYGPAYSKEEIFERLMEEKPIKNKITRIRYRKYTVHMNSREPSQYTLALGYRAYYLHYLYRLGVLPRNRVRYDARYAAALEWDVRDDLINIKNILEEAKMLNKNRIQTREELDTFREECMEKYTAIQEGMKGKSVTPEERQSRKEQGKALKKLIRMCDMVQRRTDRKNIQSPDYEAERSQSMKQEKTERWQM